MAVWILLVVCIDNSGFCHMQVGTDTAAYSEAKECTKHGNMVRDMFESKPSCDKYVITCEKKTLK